MAAKSILSLLRPRSGVRAGRVRFISAHPDDYPTRVALELECVRSKAYRPPSRWLRRQAAALGDQSVIFGIECLGP